ncbi:hypothetical protein INR49_014511 [Caranx melampygus]|nr:hypothetical protein INR49_014511 [Caranx melampygus]
MFKQESSSSKPEPERKEETPMCDVHEDEKINIYCVTHSVPTCSMCKVFGAHKDCEVAPISTIYETKKENGRRQKTLVCEKFDHLYSILEERKRSMSQKVTAEQEEKLNYIRGLTRKYGDHLEESCKIVEMGIQTMEEPEMALFLQNTKPLLKKIAEASSTAHLDKVERGYENMDHFSVDFKRESKALRAIDFLEDDDEEEEDEETEAEAEEGEGAQTVSGSSAVTAAPLVYARGCSALDISIISRSRWKVRSSDIGGSSDLLPLSIDSSPRSPKPLMSALMFPTFPCKRRRVSWSCKALL